MTTLFISDLHVDSAHPEIAEQLHGFLSAEAREAEAVYILGDLFESWIGDDDPDATKHGVVAALRSTVDSGTPCFFMRGNRDFLAGEGFARASGCTLLTDPTTIELHGERVVLMHGDTLCTDDTDYQAFRSMVRDPKWQASFLAQGVEERLALAGSARAASRARTSRLDEEIMDVNLAAVRAALRGTGARVLLHGHTHRPAVHRFDMGDRPATRIVLGDWYSQGSVLRWGPGGFELESIPR